MSWTLYRWTWALESPLHIGATPAGSLNRCRLYVPARVLWGALAAELARQQTPEFPDYRTVGDRLRKEARFTYLFPAEEVVGKWYAWLPAYEEGGGLVWRREDTGKEASKSFEREFRRWLFWAWPSTAIDPQSDTASEGTLRETECLNTRWRGKDGTAGSQVAMVGYVFLHDGSDLRNELDKFVQITVGGDIRYGYGRLRRIGMDPATGVFDLMADPQGLDPMVHGRTVYAHANDGAKPSLAGDREVLVGWDMASGGCLSAMAGSPLWRPGSHTSNGSAVAWKVMPNGLWEIVP
ncbi:MAG: hypothetical protein D6791_18805 [Chloroflexi bacterium]|nr:MAG: hypothetical protein D6791_18805 [Chloroflexota bacterium]